MLPGMDICFFQGHRALSLNSKLNLASAAGFMTRALSPFYGWWIVAASAIILLLAGGIGYYTFGAFFTPLVDEFEWNRAQISLSMSIMGLVGLAGPLFGMWVDRYGARRVMIPGALVMGLSFACLGFTSSIYYFYAMYFVVAVGQMAILHIPVERPGHRNLGGWTWAGRDDHAAAIGTSHIRAGLAVDIPHSWGSSMCCSRPAHHSGRQG